MEKKKLSKKNILTIIVASVMVVILSVGLGVYFGVFHQEKYDVDLAAVKAQNPFFADEFDGTELNQDAWIIEKGVGDTSWRRGGYWKPEQVLVEDGKLKIRTEKVGEEWHTGALITKEQWEFGYFEVSCKLPKGYGIWAAFWMLSDEFGKGFKTGKEGGAEIDVMEAPCWPVGKVQQAIHKGGYEENHNSIFNPKWLAQSYDGLYDEFHNYGVFWNEDIYKFYVDGVCVWTTNYKKDTARNPHFMFLSVEIGGAEGLPKYNDWSFVGGKVITVEGNDKNFPSDFEIDYVKAWDVSNFRK